MNRAARAAMTPASSDKAPIFPVEYPFAGNILSQKTRIVGNLLGLLILPIFFGGALLGLAGIYLLSDESKQHGWPDAVRNAASLLLEVAAPVFLSGI
jgi:hypothetical protein